MVGDKNKGEIDWLIGKTSPGAGANYHYEEAKNKFTYENDPAWVFGTDERNTLDTKAKYDHYYIIDKEVT